MSQASNKGALVISESMLMAFGIVITIILLLSFGYFFFQTQLAGAEESSWEAIGREVANYIDRAGAESGSVAIEYQPPQGAEFDLAIDYKRVKISPQGKASKAVSIPFSTVTKLEEPIVISNPIQLCIYKDQQTSTIAVTPGSCQCNPNDGICSPGCLIEATPDPACNSPNQDYVCDPRVSSAGDGVCDPDCYRNAKDDVDETLDCNQEDKIKEEVGDIKIIEEDGICDLDTRGEKNGICDLDCHSNQENGLYDPDCTIDSDGDGIEDKNDSICNPDGFKDLDDDGEIEAKNGVCDLDCAAMETNCDPDCGPSKDEGCGNCAEEGEKVPDDGSRCCQPGDGVGTNQKLVRCPGDNICRSASDKLACEGNGICEVPPLIDVDTSPGYLAQWPMNSSPYHWENELLLTSSGIPSDCRNVADGICYPTQDQNSNNRPSTTDPDCAGSGNKCQWVRVHPPGGAGSDSDCDGISSGSAVSDGTCSPIAYDGCDPDCASSNSIIDPDCSESQNPAQDCATRVDKGDYTEVPCGYDEDNNPQCFEEGKIEVCHPAIVDYIDRRGRDIDQILGGFEADTPRGFAFNHNRYDPTSAQNCACTTQRASKTVLANERYSKSERECCTDSSCGCPSCPVVSECAGVGFCGDHSVAVLSILRTLGIPPDRVWSVFSVSDSVHHGWTAYKCGDSSKDPDTEWDDCSSDEWMAIDATHHVVRKLEDHGTACDAMRLWFNDQGKYQEQYEIDCGSTTYDSSNCQINNGQVECSASTSGCQIKYPHRSPESCNSNSCPLHFLPVNPSSFCN